MRLRVRNLALVAAAALLLLLPSTYLLRAERRNVEAEPLRTLNAYLKAAYARDFKKAYGFIAARDRRLKKEKVYVREKGPFSGFALEVARKLSELIEARPLQTVVDGTQTRVKLAFKLPDANSLSSLVLDWDEERLNALPIAAQQKILTAIDRLSRAGGLKMIEGEEEFTMVKEGSSWRVFFDWANGLRISYDAVSAAAEFIEAEPLTRETRVKPSELFTVTYRVKSRAAHPITTRIIHRVEPEELRQHIDIIECALLLPVKMLPGQESEFSTTYMVRGDLPEGAKNLNISYEFQMAQ